MPNGKSLWALALSALRPEERTKLNFESGEDHIRVLADLQVLTRNARDECVKKQWKCSFKHQNGETIILRDLFSKLVVWVDRFVAVGDSAVQFDPVHTAIPWAGVKFLVMFATADIKRYDFAVGAAETIAYTIDYYACFEELYLSSSSKFHEKAEEALLALYSLILKYLLEIKRFFERSTATRIIQSLSLAAGKTVEFERDISVARKSAGDYAALIHAEAALQSRDHLLKSATGVNHRLEKFSTFLNDLSKPIDRLNDQLSNVQDFLESSARLNILSWISTEPYLEHHAQVKKGRIGETGKWLLDDGLFKQWQRESVSSLFWLRGSTGTGKSKLASIIIDYALQNAQAGQCHHPIFFYCSRNSAEPHRGDPYYIIASLVRQLSVAHSGGPLLAPTRDLYDEKKGDGLNISKPSLEELTSLFVDLVEQRQVTTVVIDALDECHVATRFELFDFLEVVLEEANSLLKIFVTSWDEGDIRTQLSRYPNLTVSSERNFGDIQLFIRVETERLIKKRRLLAKSQARDELKNLIVQTLTRDAKGMFRWAAMQLEALCMIKVDADIRQRLETLPEKLFAIYLDIHERMIRQAGPTECHMIEHTFSWLMCANSLVDTTALLKIVGIDALGGSVEETTEILLDVCNNFIARDDALNTLRFAHPSVRSFLLSHPNYSTEMVNAKVATGCLTLIIARSNTLLSRNFVSQHNPLYLQRKPTPLQSLPKAEVYAMDYWESHCRLSGNLRKANPLSETLRFFFMGDTSVDNPLNTWHRFHRRYPTITRRNFLQTMELHADPLTRALLVAAESGMTEIFQECRSKVTLSEELKQALLVIVADSARYDILDSLLDQGIAASIAQSILKQIGVFGAFQGRERAFELILNKCDTEKLCESFARDLCETYTVGIMEIFIRRVGPGAISPSLLSHAARVANPTIFKYLTQTTQFTVSDRIMKAACRNIHDARECMQFLLDQGMQLDLATARKAILTWSAPAGIIDFLEMHVGKIHVTHKFLKKVARLSSPDVMMDLLHRGEKVTPDLILAAVQSTIEPRLMTENLLSRSKDIKITSEMVLLAVQHSSSAADVLRVLFAHGPLPPLNEAIVRAGVSVENPELVQLLLEHGGARFLTSRVLYASMTASQYRFQRGKSSLETIFRKCSPSDVFITDRMVEHALRNLFFDEAILELFNWYRGPKVTNRMLTAALENPQCSDEMVAFVLERDTERVLKLDEKMQVIAFAANGRTVRDALHHLEKRFGTIEAGPDVLLQTLERGHAAMISLLMDRHPEWKFTSEHLMVALKGSGSTGQSNGRIIQLILLREPGIVITDEILLSLLKNFSWRGETLLNAFIDYGIACQMTPKIYSAMLNLNREYFLTAIKLLEAVCGTCAVNADLLVETAEAHHSLLFSHLIKRTDPSIVDNELLFRVAITGSVEIMELLLGLLSDEHERDLWRKCSMAAAFKSKSRLPRSNALEFDSESDDYDDCNDYEDDNDHDIEQEKTSARFGVKHGNQPSVLAHLTTEIKDSRDRDGLNSRYCSSGLLARISPYFGLTLPNDFKCAGFGSLDNRLLVYEALSPRVPAPRRNSLNIMSRHKRKTPLKRSLDEVEITIVNGLECDDNDESIARD